VQAAQPATSEDTPPPQVVPPVATPPETSPQPTAETMPTATTGQPEVVEATTTPQAAPPAANADDLAKAVAARVAQAKQAFITKLAEAYEHQLYMRLAITFEFMWLKIGNQEQYVDAVLAKFQATHPGGWMPAKKTLQHYEGPMLRWLEKLARKKNPKDPALKGKFSPTFLNAHPKYILDLNIDEEKLIGLAHDCKTMVGLDKKWGNDRVKPAKQTSKLSAAAINPSIPSNPTQAVPKANQTQAKTAGADPQRTQDCKPRNQLRHPSPSEEDEPAPPTDDEMLATLRVFYYQMLARKKAGEPLHGDIKKELFRCVKTAGEINEYFRISKTLTA